MADYRLGGAGLYVLVDLGSPGAMADATSRHTTSPPARPSPLRVIAKDTLTSTVYAAGEVECDDGSTRTNVVVRLDQKVPDVALAITGFSENGGPVQPAIDCATIVQGMTARDVLGGRRALRKAHPHRGAGGVGQRVTVVPGQRVYGAPDFVPTVGEAGSWSLDTTGMDPCGYTVRLHASDRTIVGCGGPWWDEIFVGFCLDAPDD